MNKKKIAILYIATGPYIHFWNELYDSFEKYFLKNTEVHYFIFTDAKSIYQQDNERIHIKYSKPAPWPLPTLMKFHTFLEYEEELSHYDYIYNSNANVACKKEVLEEDFLPREELGEKLIFTRHPGFLNTKPYNFPYERSKRSLAYVPYNCGKDFVYGAMNGGTAKAYLEFARKLDNRIVEDLKHNVIAYAHDESHINREIISRNDYRILSSSYSYPWGFSLPSEYECIITATPKATVFDVNTFKGVTTPAKRSFWTKSIGRLGRIIKSFLHAIYAARDFLMRCRV